MPLMSARLESARDWLSSPSPEGCELAGEIVTVPSGFLCATKEFAPAMLRSRRGSGRGGGGGRGCRPLSLRSLTISWMIRHSWVLCPGPWRRQPLASFWWTLPVPLHAWHWNGPPPPPPGDGAGLSWPKAAAAAVTASLQ